MTLFNMLPGILVALSFYGFYRNLFAESPGIRLPGVAFFFSLASVGLAILLEILLGLWIQQETVFIQAFFLSSLPEETAKFLFIYIYFRINRIEHSLSEGIFYGILFGLFFGLVENAFYGLDLGLWPMLVRSTTALPLHMITGGILGAFVLTYENSNPKNLPILELILGFLLCFLLHAIYNFGVFSSGTMLYILPVVLFVGFFLLEYEIMVSRNTLPREVMDLIGIKWDDYRIIHRFKQYLEWMDVYQDVYHAKNIPIFKFPPWRTIGFALGVLGLGISTFSYLILFPEMIAKTFLGIQFPEYVSIFVFYPIFTALVLGFSGTLNPDYFRSKILQIPLFISLYISTKSGDYEETTVVFYISRKGFYVPLMDADRFGEDVNLEFWISGRIIKNIPGKIFWKDWGDNAGNGGALVRFERTPWKLVFFWNFAIFRQRLKNMFHLSKIK